MSKLLSPDTESSNITPFAHKSELVRLSTVPSVKVMSAYLRYCISVPLFTFSFQALDRFRLLSPLDHIKTDRFRPLISYPPPFYGSTAVTNVECSGFVFSWHHIRVSYMDIFWIECLQNLRCGCPVLAAPLQCQLPFLCDSVFMHQRIVGTPGLWSGYIIQPPCVCWRTRHRNAIDF